MGEFLPDKPFLVFDGDCSFCKAWIEYWRKLTGGRVLYAPYQEVADRFPRIASEEFRRAVQLVLPTGEVRSGAHAVFTSLESVPGKGWMLWFYEHVPVAAPLCDAGYRVIARHRPLAYTLTKFVWGVPLEPPKFRLASWLFLRLLGIIYFIAFLSFGVQARGLIGSQGILPVAQFLPSVREYLGKAAYWNVPTLLWFRSSDAFLRGIWIAGVCVSLALTFGFSWRIVRIALLVLYLSLVTAGQIFMGYQWDALLLEAGFLAIFLGSSSIIVWLFRWLLFRLMFLSGSVKLLSGDPTWRHFTALNFHYETQPLPTPLAWYFFQLPAWFQHFSVGVVFFVELFVPFLIFAPRRIRFFAAMAIAVFQLLIFLTGNYAFFNLLTMALCLFLLDDRLLRRFLPRRLTDRTPAPSGVTRELLRTVACRSVATLVIFVSGFQLLGTFAHFHWDPAETVMGTVAPFQIVNTYGLFAVMTTTRPEIILEGSNDGQTWLPYEFKYKPGDLSRHPAWVQPHQPRLDWQMWFAALGDYRSDPWTVQLMGRLLQGSPDVLKLLGKNPFPGAPPRFVRAQLYEYRFTTAAERRATGDWWQREFKGAYLPVLSLRGK
jgi:predicted DCC family thiol-disulfide oxidoreductase YuxK